MPESEWAATVALRSEIGARVLSGIVINCLMRVTVVALELDDRVALNNTRVQGDWICPFEQALNRIGAGWGAGVRRPPEGIRKSCRPPSFVAAAASYN